MSVKINYKGEILEFDNTPSLGEIKKKYKELQRADSTLNKKELFTVTKSQEQLYYYEMMSKNTNLYCVPIVFRITQFIHVEYLKSALNKLTERHSVLRTTFEMNEESVIQRINNFKECAFTCVNISDLPDSEKEVRVKEIIQQEVNSGFSFDGEALFRSKLIKCSNEMYYLLLNIHHIIFDVVSESILLHDLSYFYQMQENASIPELETLGFNFAEYADSLNVQIMNGKLDKHKSYWLKELENEIPYLNIKSDFVKEKDKTFQGDTVQFILEKSISLQIKELCRQNHVTMHVFYLASLAAMIFRYTAAGKFAIWSPLSRRTDSIYENQIGYYTDMYPILFSLNGKQSFLELLVYTQEKCISALEHQEYPFANAEQDYMEQHNGERIPDIQLSFEYVKKEDSYLGDILLEPVEILYQKAKYDLDISVLEENDAVKLILDYSSSLYTKEHMKSFLAVYQQIINSIIEHKEEAIEQLSMLSEQQLEQCAFALSGLKGTSLPYQNVFEMFEASADQYPNKIAIMDGAEQATYQELNQLANKVAHWLLSQNVKIDDKVTVLLDKSISAVAYMLGIIKSGCAYMPLSEDFTQMQLKAMMESADSLFAITQTKYKDKLKGFQGKLFVIDEPEYQEVLNRQSGKNPKQNVGQDNLLNILHTSGTTGMPKGVALTHRGILRLLGKTEYLSFAPDDIVLQLSGLDYDGATMEIWGTLCHGGTLILMQKEKILDIDAFAEMIINNQVTTVIFPTQLFNRMADEHPETLALLRQIECGGEVISIEHVRKALKYCKPGTIINGYGPTENTFVSTFYRIKELRPECTNIPIGIPVTNTTAYVLDQNLNPVPDYVVGELYLAGDGLAKGYLNNEEVNCKSFVKNPFDKQSAYLYKTGDFVIKTADGNLEFVSRLDGQVKIRGHRIETEALRNLILNHSEVKESYIDFESHALYAYIRLQNACTKQDEANMTKQLRSEIIKQLSQYAVPERFIYLNEIPLTRTGKVNVKELRRQKSLVQQSTIENHKTETEQKMFEIWTKVLNYNDFYVTDNFFDIGGHSLLLSKVLKMVRETFSVSLPIIDLFQYTTIKQLSQHIDAICKKDGNIPDSEPAKEKKQIKHSDSSDIAVIGMGLRFPMADTPHEFWGNIRNGVNCISKLTDDEIVQLGEQVNRKKLVPYGGYIENEFAFDPDVFGISEAEAAMMDPQQRILLMCAWEAIEDAGYNIDNIDHDMAVYIGGEKNEYFSGKDNQTIANAFHSEIASSPEFLPLKISYHLNLNGESILVNTGCSSSLVSIHMACQSLLQGNCNYAMAGGVSLRIPQRTGYLYEEGFIMSPNGQCAAFDKDAKGTVDGNGAGIVLLKRLDDAIRDKDSIYAVIKGTAANNDGKNKIGFTAPGLTSQIAVIEKAIKRSNVSKSQIGLIETHGTGTKLGDQIEITGLKEVFKECANHPNSCAIGSVKSNIGHLNIAAGIAGFIKACLAVYHKELPPTLHVKEVNPEFHLEESPFFVCTEKKEWTAEKGLRTAGISSFGIGGTNSHIIVQEYREHQKGDE